MGLEPDPHLDAAAALDFLSHVLLREFLRGLQYVDSEPGRPFAEWAGLGGANCAGNDFAVAIAPLAVWRGWYERCRTLEDLLVRCEERLQAWKDFTDANIQRVPADVWETKTTPSEPMHAIGNLLRERSALAEGLPLFVTIDQYEVLPELNRTFGTTLQRAVNSLIKARDPVVFYKIGARTYDWGRETRAWPSDSRIEEQRDFRILDLATLLMRHESGQWLFPRVAKDVVRRRIESLKARQPGRAKRPDLMFGKWTADSESWMYFKSGRSKDKEKPLSQAELRWLSGKLEDNVLETVLEYCPEPRSPLNVRLACAWAAQKTYGGSTLKGIELKAEAEPWGHRWWRKERVGVALVQIASQARQRKLYYGWQNIQYLAGGNITALIYMLGEIWDEALRNGVQPLVEEIPPSMQSEGIRKAAERWLARDKNEVSKGAKRHAVVQRLGDQIHSYLVADEAISNPGHTGFSVNEADLADPKYESEREFLLTAVHWAILEERVHTSKTHTGDRRRKFFLHPLLSAAFNIPTKRVKEPLYTSMSAVQQLIQERVRLFIRKEPRVRRKQGLS